MEPSSRFARYLRFRSVLDDPFVELDLSHSALTEASVATLQPQLQAALDAMAALEQGGVANPDEGRMVGHFWLRAPGLAPDDAVGEQIRAAVEDVEQFAAAAHSGAVAPPEGGRFNKVVLRDEIGFSEAEILEIIKANFDMRAGMLVRELDNP